MKIVPTTVRTLVDAFHESSPTGDSAGPTRHVYEAGGVSSKTVGTLLFRVASLSKVGTVPLEVAQPCVGPGMAFTYHVVKSEAGAAMIGGVELTPTVFPGTIWRRSSARPGYRSTARPGAAL